LGPNFLSTVDSCDENEKSDLEWTRKEPASAKERRVGRMKDKREGREIASGRVVDRMLDVRNA